MWEPLIVCGNTDPNLTLYTHDCVFSDLIVLAQHLVTNMIILSTFFAVAAFAYAGIKLLASGGNESAMKDAKSILTKVLIGYLWILGAWVLVYTITTVLLKPEVTNFLG